MHAYAHRKMVYGRGLNTLPNKHPFAFSTHIPPLLIRLRVIQQQSLYRRHRSAQSKIRHQGFFQDIRQEGANVTIGGGMYYCCFFQGFCHRGNVIAHS